MSNEGKKFTAGLGNLRASATAFWSARSEQERRYLAAGGIVVGLALVYALFIDPALTGRERLRRELGSLGPIEVAPLQVDDGREVYRVRVGPFSSDAAARAQNQIATYGVADSAIVTD